uniref:N-glycosylase/DNA lyase n=1 Tax=Ignisphaera aggregans TaxID=334771 RepID=A0A7J3QCX0_9CREN
MRYRINYDRIETISNVFKILGINKIKMIEVCDMQFHVAKQLSMLCPQISKYLLYLNSLVSYRLMYHGEKFWVIFAQYVSEKCVNISDFKDAVDLVIDFSMKYNRIMINQKVDRLRRIKRCNEVVRYIDNHEFGLLAKYTAKCLNNNPNSKTVVFSIKMLYYELKSKGFDIVLPNTIAIPVDRRVALITYLSCLLDILNENDINASKLLKISNTIRKIWQKISLLSSIPSLHIDSVIWYLGKYSNLNSRSSILNSIDKCLISMIGEDDVKYLVDELFYRLPP